MRVVITGASRGIGRATALKLAAEGAEAMTLCDVAYLDELEALATNLRTSGCKVRTLRADMVKPTAPARVIAAAVKAMGGIDALVGNAGITAPAKLVDLDLATWNRVFDINLRANWLLAKAALYSAVALVENDLHDSFDLVGFLHSQLAVEFRGKSGPGRIVRRQGLLLVAAHRASRRGGVAAVTLAVALAVGLAQVLALIPGTCASMICHVVSSDRLSRLRFSATSPA